MVTVNQGRRVTEESSYLWFPCAVYTWGWQLSAKLFSAALRMLPALGAVTGKSTSEVLMRGHVQETPSQVSSSSVKAQPPSLIETAACPPWASARKSTSEVGNMRAWLPHWTVMKRQENPYNIHPSPPNGATTASFECWKMVISKITIYMVKWAIACQSQRHPSKLRIKWF
jgi:hypothetical protein